MVSAVNSKSVGKSSSFGCELLNVVECGVGIDSAGGADGVGADGFIDEAIFLICDCVCGLFVLVVVVIAVDVVVVFMINQYHDLEFAPFPLQNAGWLLSNGISRIISSGMIA